MHRKHNPDNAPRLDAPRLDAPRLDSESASLALPLCNWIITVESDPQRRPREVVAAVIKKFEDYAKKNRLGGEVAFVDSLDDTGAIAIRCSARLAQIIEEFPEVLRVDECGSFIY